MIAYVVLLVVGLISIGIWGYLTIKCINLLEALWQLDTHKFFYYALVIILLIQSCLLYSIWRFLL